MKYDQTRQKLFELPLGWESAPKITDSTPPTESDISSYVNEYWKKINLKIKQNLDHQDAQSICQGVFWKEETKGYINNNLKIWSQMINKFKWASKFSQNSIFQAKIKTNIHCAVASHS